MRTIEIGLDVHRLIEAARTSFEQSEDDILRSLLQSQSVPVAAENRSEPKSTETAIAIGKRTTGQWSVIDGDTTYFGRNLREAYITAVSCLAKRNPSLLEALAKLGGTRRRAVAAKASDLYPRSPHLADPQKNNWHKLGDWYVDLNLSRNSVAKRIKHFCTLSGVNYGKDFQIKEGLEVL